MCGWVRRIERERGEGEGGNFERPVFFFGCILSNIAFFFERPRPRQSPITLVALGKYAVGD